jgi:hypothetical protein
MGTIIIKNVPEDLKREFKAICALKGTFLIIIVPIQYI